MRDNLVLDEPRYRIRDVGDTKLECHTQAEQDVIENQDFIFKPNSRSRFQIDNPISYLKKMEGT